MDRQSRLSKGYMFCEEQRKSVQYGMEMQRKLNGNGIEVSSEKISTPD